MSTPANTLGYPRFMELPPELRLVVYDSIIAVDTTLQSYRTWRRNAIYDFKIFARFVAGGHASCLEVNRETRNELRRRASLLCSSSPFAELSMPWAGIFAPQEPRFIRTVFVTINLPEIRDPTTPNRIRIIVACLHVELLNGKPNFRVNINYLLQHTASATPHELHCVQLCDTLQSTVEACIGWIMASKRAGTQTRFWLMNWQDAFDVIRDMDGWLRTSYYAAWDGRYLESSSILHARIVT
jgi:hypothetical protein